MANKVFIYDYCTPTKVIDGDTFWCVIDLGVHLRLETKIRLHGIDCPERGTVEWERARNRLRDLLGFNSGKPHLVRCSSISKPKYAARLICQVWVPDGREVGGILLSEGLAKEYGGGFDKALAGEGE